MSNNDIYYLFRATVVGNYGSQTILEDDSGNIILSGIQNSKIGNVLDIVVTSSYDVLSVNYIRSIEINRTPTLVTSKNYKELRDLDSYFTSKCVKITGVLQNISATNGFFLINDIDDRGIICFNSSEVSPEKLSECIGKEHTFVGYFYRNGFIIVEIQ